MQVGYGAPAFVCEEEGGLDFHEKNAMLPVLDDEDCDEVYPGVIHFVVGGAAFGRDDEFIRQGEEGTENCAVEGIPSVFLFGFLIDGSIRVQNDVGPHCWWS